MNNVNIKHNNTKRIINIKQHNESNVAKFKAEISHAELYSKLDLRIDADPNINYDILELTITDAANKHLPTKTIKVNKHKHKKSKWITFGIIKSIKFRDKLYTKLKKTATNTLAHDTLSTNLKTYNKILKNSNIAAKGNFYHARFALCKHDIKKTWATINDIIKRDNKEEISECFLLDGVLSNDSKKITEEFNSFLSNIGLKLAREMESTTNVTYKNFLTNACLNTLSLLPINEETTIKIIDDLKAKHSEGVDGLSVKLLKAIKYETSKAITHIINQSLHTGIFPDKLKLAKVIPVFKKGDRTKLDNYRPISILPAISKIFERVIFDQLYIHFTHNNLFYESQYGFKKKHSTEFAVLELIDRITQSLDNGQTPINIYLDLSKAFDTLDHSILLHKLSHYGVNDSALKLLSSYLSNRKQYVNYRNCNSELTPLHVGVPQGSILGPLLFIIYVNDISVSSNIFKFTMYAYDTTLSTTIDSTNENNCSTELINNELLKIHDWLLVNKLSLNVPKTKFMVFCMPQKKVVIPRLKIANTEIDSVDRFNFLGVLLDKHLSWDAHTNALVGKISRTTGILNKLKLFLPQYILKTIYTTLILCQLNYGILAWGHNNNRVYKLQKRAVRIISCSKFNAHSEPLLKQLNLLKVEDILKLQQLKFYHKLINKQLPGYFTCFPITPATEIHQHSTRAASKLFITRANHEFAKKSLRHSIIVTVNNTITSITNKTLTHSLDGFAKYVKKSIIQSYESNCSINNCYVCSSLDP